MGNEFQLVMDKPMLNKSGFTLIETLFVLMIMCILFTITMTLHIPQKKESVYIEEITSFFYEAKLHAMTSKETVDISVNDQLISYQSQSKSKEYLLKEGCYFLDYQMSFNASGHIKVAKTLEYHHDQHVYYFVYQVGSGTFYVK